MCDESSPGIFWVKLATHARVADLGVRQLAAAPGAEDQ